jgi:hypothetical protein
MGHALGAVQVPFGLVASTSSDEQPRTTILPGCFCSVTRLAAVPVFVHTRNCTSESNRNVNSVTFSDTPDNSTHFYEWQPALPPVPTARSCQKQTQTTPQTTSAMEMVATTIELFSFLHHSLPPTLTAGIQDTVTSVNNQGENEICL